MCGRLMRIGVQEAPGLLAVSGVGRLTQCLAKLCHWCWEGPGAGRPSGGSWKWGGDTPSQGHRVKAEARLGRADQCQTPIILKVTNYNWKCVEIGYWQFIASLMKEDCDSSDDKLPANLELMWDLLHVDACKSMGSNEIHPRVLRAGQHQGQASLNCLSVGICRGASWLPDKEWPR